MVKPRADQIPKNLCGLGKEKNLRRVLLSGDYKTAGRKGQSTFAFQTFEEQKA
tara:strand:- start:27 stop:185 length:159 start_codon:yes stop_codon:yes gene_type:complete